MYFLLLLKYVTIGIIPVSVRGCYWCVHSSVSHYLNEALIPYNVLLLRYRPSIVAHPPAVPAYIATGLASAGLF